MSRKTDIRKEARLALIFDWVGKLEARHAFYLKRIRSKATSSEAEAERQGAREMMELSLEVMRACREVSGNPIFAWQGVRFCIEAATPFPAWVERYLLESSRGLIGKARAQDKTAQKAGIEKALGFSEKARGGKNKFTGFLKTIEEVAELARLYRARLYSNATLEEIEVALAAQRYPKNEGRREAYLRNLTNWRKALSKIPADIQI